MMQIQNNLRTNKCTEVADILDFPGSAFVEWLAAGCLPFA